MSFDATGRTAFFRSRWPVQGIFVDTGRIWGRSRADRAQVSPGHGALEFSGRTLQPYPLHAPAALKGVGGVYAEEYPYYFRDLGAGHYPPEALVLLVVPEAAFQAASHFLGDDRRQFFPLPLMFSSPSLPLEVGTDIVSRGETSVLVGAIDGIAPDNLDLCPCQPLHAQDGLPEPYPLVEGVEGKVLNKADATWNLCNLDPNSTGFFSFPVLWA